MAHWSIGVAIVVATLGGLSGINGVLAEEAILDASGLPVPAWQTDPALATQWRELTGKFIFQRACISCHNWGPEHFEHEVWESYLSRFPNNHEPDVTEVYGDLTAQFTPGKKVPNLDQRTDALTTYLLSKPEAQEVRMDSWDGFPRVGDVAPEFEIVDIDGRSHSLDLYRGEKALVLVFSRAHW